jgi:uncharacterized Fe-S cluster-containing radical SAM superfamily protein
MTESEEGQRGLTESAVGREDPMSWFAGMHLVHLLRHHVMYGPRGLGSQAIAAILRAKNAAIEPFDRTPLYCRALAGESDYNICVNSDMTVSCNCQDFDGTGHIGDLRSESLEEIFLGERVSRLQAALASRSFPTSVCRFCREVAPIPAERRRDGPVSAGLPVRGIMVENTALCNLRCGLCHRADLLALRRQASMSLEDVAQVAKMVAEYRIELVSYFNLGEPFLSRSILAEVTTLREYNPDIKLFTSTNGVLLDSEEKLAAALLMDYVYFSIDGTSTDMVVRYQVGGDFERSFQNMTSLVEARERLLARCPTARAPRIEWKYVLFRWNDDVEHLTRALDLGRQAGVDRISFHLGGGRRRRRSLDPRVLGPVLSEGGCVRVGRWDGNRASRVGHSVGRSRRRIRLIP